MDRHTFWCSGFSCSPRTKHRSKI